MPTGPIEAELEKELQALPGPDLDEIDCPQERVVRAPGGTFECSATYRSGRRATIVVTQGDTLTNFSWELVGD